MWGWAAQLSRSTHSAESWGFGDLADLRRLAAWSAELGAGVLMVNPLVAASPTLPQNPSPYYPTSRRYRNPLYLRIEQVPGAERLGGDLQRLAALGHELNSGKRLDRDRVFQLKQEAFRGIWAGFTQDDAFDRFCKEHGRSLEIFGLYCALAERHGARLAKPGWPEFYVGPIIRPLLSLSREQANAMRYHQWLQWLLDRQLAEAAGYVSLVQDLPIGMDHGGADAWEWQDLLANDMTVGAPPDAFNGDGQNWALPPFIPTALRAAGYEPFIQTIRATLPCWRAAHRPAGYVGLFRLWCDSYGGTRPARAKVAIRPTICWALLPWRAVGLARSLLAKTSAPSSPECAIGWRPAIYFPAACCGLNQRRRRHSIRNWPWPR